MRAAMIVALCVVATVPSRLVAQAPASTDRAAFQAASVKPNKSGDLRTRVTLEAGGRFTATNVSLRNLIARAYGASGTLTTAFVGLSNSQVVGGADWLDSDRFDVAATAASATSPDQIRFMLQSLLADRFKLTFHTEPRNMPVFALVMSKRDHSKGPRLRDSVADCAHTAASTDPPPLVDGLPACNFIGPARPGGSAPQTTFAFRGLTMQTFAAFLTPTVRRVVLDRTGLLAHFDGEFDAAAELGPPPPPPGLPDALDRPSLPSIFTVLDEQLGLKLDSTTGPVDVMVIDHVEHPTEN